VGAKLTVVEAMFGEARKQLSGSRRSESNARPVGGVAGADSRGTGIDKDVTANTDRWQASEAAAPTTVGVFANTLDAFTPGVEPRLPPRA
jgi:hypothetical protein